MITAGSMTSDVQLTRATLDEILNCLDVPLDAKLTFLTSTTGSTPISKVSWNSATNTVILQ